MPPGSPDEVEENEQRQHDHRPTIQGKRHREHHAFSRSSAILGFAELNCLLDRIDATIIVKMATTCVGSNSDQPM